MVSEWAVRVLLLVGTSAIVVSHNSATLKTLATVYVGPLSQRKLLADGVESLVLHSCRHCFQCTRKLGGIDLSSSMDFISRSHSCDDPESEIAAPLLRIRGGGKGKESRKDSAKKNVLVADADEEMAGEVGDDMPNEAEMEAMRESFMRVSVGKDSIQVCAIIPSDR